MERRFVKSGSETCKIVYVHVRGKKLKLKKKTEKFPSRRLFRSRPRRHRGARARDPNTRATAKCNGVLHLTILSQCTYGAAPARSTRLSNRRRRPLESAYYRTRFRSDGEWFVLIFPYSHEHGRVGCTRFTRNGRVP